MKFNKNLKMKKLDEYGLPIDDGYNYYRHIASKSGTQGVVIAELFAEDVHREKLTIDCDYNIKDMNDE